MHHSHALLTAVIFLIAVVGPARRTHGVDSSDSKIENVILVTMDGLRFQELFGGADRRLIDPDYQPGPAWLEFLPNSLRDATGLPSSTAGLQHRFWADDTLERRRRLMPFFWNIIAENGQVFGSPNHQSQITVENGRYFSYPGYNELLCGFADNRIDSNDKKYNENTTVLEHISRLDGFQDRVAAFCSWDVFPYIINDRRSGIPVNAGWQPIEVVSNDLLKDAYNDLAQSLPHYWGGVRYDAFTFRAAAEYMTVKQPRLIYVALGETDDWAHAGKYELYLEMARANDEFIKRLWEVAQSIDAYRGKTAIVISTDHGRGDGREGWKDHGVELPGSERIWIAVMGPGIKPLGIRRGVNGTQGQVAATVAHLFGVDLKSLEPKAQPPLPLEKLPKEDVQPLPQAHAHNDYYHDRPLLNALDCGFCSVEADIFLVDEELRVGHSRSELQPGRTLESMYLRPLRQRIFRNNGNVYAKPEHFTLLVDIKTNGEKVYPVLDRQLAEYRDILSRYEDGKFTKGAIQVVVSGDRPRQLIQEDPSRYVGIDGRLSDLDSKAPSHLIPLISDRWLTHFKWRGDGEFPIAERTKLRTIVEKAHAAGRRVRFWATPESKAVWRELIEAGVDHINTDRLQRLQRFLQASRESDDSS